MLNPKQTHLRLIPYDLCLSTLTTTDNNADKKPTTTKLDDVTEYIEKQAAKN